MKKLIIIAVVAFALYYFFVRKPSPAKSIPSAPAPVPFYNHQGEANGTVILDSPSDSGNIGSSNSGTFTMPN